MGAGGRGAPAIRPAALLPPSPTSTALFPPTRRVSWTSGSAGAAVGEAAAAARGWKDAHRAAQEARLQRLDDLAHGALHLKAGVRVGPLHTAHRLSGRQGL